MGGGASAEINDSTTEPVYGICILKPDGGSGVEGVITLCQIGDETTITGELTGLTPGNKYYLVSKNYCIAKKKAFHGYFSL